jgi:hypothetical protein
MELAFSRYEVRLMRTEKAKAFDLTQEPAKRREAFGASAFGRGSRPGPRSHAGGVVALRDDRCAHDPGIALGIGKG